MFDFVHTQKCRRLSDSRQNSPSGGPQFNSTTDLSPFQYSVFSTADIVLASELAVRSCLSYYPQAKNSQPFSFALISFGTRTNEEIFQLAHGEKIYSVSESKQGNTSNPSGTVKFGTNLLGIL